MKSKEEEIAFRDFFFLGEFLVKYKLTEFSTEELKEGASNRNFLINWRIDRDEILKKKKNKFFFFLLPSSGYLIPKPSKMTENIFRVSRRLTSFDVAELN